HSNLTVALFDHVVGDFQATRSLSVVFVFGGFGRLFGRGLLFGVGGGLFRRFVRGWCCAIGWCFSFGCCCFLAFVVGLAAGVAAGLAADLVFITGFRLSLRTGLRRAGPGRSFRRLVGLLRQ